MLRNFITISPFEIVFGAVLPELCNKCYFPLYWASNDALRNRHDCLCFRNEVFRPEELANFGFTLPARPVFLVKFHEAQGAFERLFF